MPAYHSHHTHAFGHLHRLHIAVRLAVVNRAYKQFTAALEAVRKLFPCEPLLKAPFGAPDTGTYVHGMARYYACMYLSVVCVAHPPDLCHSCYIGPRTWTGQQYCIRCLIHPGSLHLISLYVRTH